MNISIPDKFFKFLVLAGVLLLVFSYYQKEKINADYYSKIDNFNAVNDSISVEIVKTNDFVKDFFGKADSFAKKYDVKNPLRYGKDSVMIFEEALNGPKNVLIVSDSIKKYWSKYGEKNRDLSVLILKAKLINKRLEDEEKFKDSLISNLGYFDILGALSFLVGFLIWFVSDLSDQNNEEGHYQKKLKDRIYVHCQSCGNRFSSMRNYGTFDNNKVNYAFCDHCFEHGKFKNPDLTLEEILNEIEKKYKRRNLIIRKLKINQIKNLERWEN